MSCKVVNQLSASADICLGDTAKQRYWENVDENTKY